MTTETSEICLLVDNGSVRDHAALFTRKLALLLKKSMGVPTVAVSLAHSDRIPIEKLNDQAVPLLEPFLESLSARNKLKKIYVIPLMMVNGGAIYTKLSESIKRFQEQNPSKVVGLGDTLVNRTDSSSISVPALMAKALELEIGREELEIGREELEIGREELDLPEVLIVDHGSPFPVATEMRDWVASEVARLLPKGRVRSVLGASMERRDGAQYDFNEPLLKRAIEDCGNRGVRDVLVAKMLIQPGKHSGKKGDIDQIIETVSAECPDTRIHVVRQVFQLKDLVSLLSVRLKNLGMGD